MTGSSKDCRVFGGSLGAAPIVIALWTSSVPMRWAIGPEKPNSLNDPADHDAPLGPFSHS